jgi:AcrR family transcriptional regulator
MESISNRQSLIGAARLLFAEKGYAAVSVDQIAARTGLTKGAVYYQFKDKRDLFRAACAAVVDEIAGQVFSTTMARVTDDLDEIVTGSEILFDAYERPEARRLLLLDGPAVLGMQEWTDMQSRLRIELGEHALAPVADAGLIPQELVPTIAHLLFGAFTQGVLQIAASDDPASAAVFIRAGYRRLVLGLLALPPD